LQRLERLAVEHSEAIARRLVEIATNESGRHEAKDSIAAARLIFDRLYGRPTERVEQVQLDEDLASMSDEELREALARWTEEERTT
jgi:hypothetical protein